MHWRYYRVSWFLFGFMCWGFGYFYTQLWERTFTLSVRLRELPQQLTPKERASHAVFLILGPISWHLKIQSPNWT